MRLTHRWRVARCVRDARRDLALPPEPSGAAKRHARHGRRHHRRRVHPEGPAPERGGAAGLAGRAADEQLQEEAPRSPARHRWCATDAARQRNLSGIRRSGTLSCMRCGRCAPWTREMVAEAQPAPRRPEARRLHCPHSAASTCAPRRVSAAMMPASAIRPGCLRRCTLGANRALMNPRARKTRTRMRTTDSVRR